MRLTRTPKILVLVAMIGVLLTACGGKTDNSGSITLATAEGTTTTTAAPATALRNGLPVVDGGDPANPMPASATNADSRTPVVRAGQITPTWLSLDGLYGSDKNYVDCAQQVLPSFNWASEVPKFKETEKKSDARFILLVNSTVPDDQAHAIASRDAGEDLSTLKVVRVGEILNTRGFTKGGCERFIDRRSMVRVSLGQVVYNTDGSVKGIEGDNGIFQDCHNPWSLVPATPAPTTTTSTSTTAPKTTATTAPKTPSTTIPKTPPTTIATCPIEDGVQTVRDEADGRCKKPEGVHDTDGGGDESKASQPGAEHPAPVVVGAPDREPPPADHSTGEATSKPGSGDAPAADPALTDDSDSKEVTTVINQPSCPWGPGECD